MKVRKFIAAILGLVLAAGLTIMVMDYREQQRTPPGPMTNEEIYNYCQHSTTPLSKCLDLFGR